MRKRIIGFAALGMFALAGCSSNKDQAGIQGVNSSQASEMNAARSKFESSEDPPLTADTHFAAGQVNELQGNLQAAIDQYQAAIKLKANHAGSLLRLALVYSQLRQYPAAVDSWKRYQAATGESALTYSNLGFCQELSGDLAAAELSYQAGTQREPKNQACRVNYGLMLARQGRIEEAKTQFLAVLTPAQAHYNIASVLQQQGKRGEARAEYHEAIKSDPQFSDAQVRLADLDRN